MPVISIPVSGSEVKIYRHAPLRKILAEDLNTLSGVNAPGSQLAIVLLLARTLIGRGSGNAYIGFRGLTYEPHLIHVPGGVVITGDGVYRAGALDFTPMAEARCGLLEMEMIQEETDPEARSFFNIQTEKSETALSPVRRSYRINFCENYVTSANLPDVTPGRIALLEYRKTAAFEDLSSVTLRITPDFDFLSVVQDLETLHAGLTLESSQRQIADDGKTYLRVAAGPGIGQPVYLRQDGNYLYFSNTPAGPFIPFA